MLQNIISKFEKTKKLFKKQTFEMDWFIEKTLLSRNFTENSMSLLIELKLIKVTYCIYLKIIVLVTTTFPNNIHNIIGLLI